MVQLISDAPQRTPADDDALAPDRGGPAATGWFRPRAVITAALVAGLAAVLAARWLTATGFQPALLGLPDAGAFTRVGLPIAQYIHELAGVAVVGLLFLRCAAVTGPAGAGHRHLTRMATRWGWLWVAGTAAWMVFTLSDLAGVPVIGLAAQPDVLFILIGTDRVLAEAATLWVALLVVLFADRATGTIGSGGLMLAAAAALLPSALSGHAGHHSGAAVATVALGVHIVAASIWVGGLLGLIVHLRRYPDQLRQAVPRFSTAALVCVVAVGISGVLASVVLLDDWAALWTTGRGQLILGKSAALVVLTAIGYQHRRFTIGAACSGRLAPLLRWGAAELTLMSATIGLAVVLSTTA